MKTLSSQISPVMFGSAVYLPGDDSDLWSAYLLLRVTGVEF